VLWRQYVGAESELDSEEEVEAAVEEAEAEVEGTEARSMPLEVEATEARSPPQPYRAEKNLLAGLAQLARGRKRGR
jgi:hypothetical protein